MSHIARTRLGPGIRSRRTSAYALRSLTASRMRLCPAPDSANRLEQQLATGNHDDITLGLPPPTTRYALQSLTASRMRLCPAPDSANRLEPHRAIGNDDYAALCQLPPATRYALQSPTATRMRSCPAPDYANRLELRRITRETDRDVSVCQYRPAIPSRPRAP